MARYIDADKVLDDMLCEMAGTGYQAIAMNVIKYAETVDVVPKSEVERLYKEVDRLSQVVLYNDSVTEMKVAEAKQEVAREIFKKFHNKFDYFKRYREVNDIISNFFNLIEGLETEYTQSEGKE